MKKRYLKPRIQRVLECIWMMLVIFFGSLCPFDPTLPVIAMICSLMALLALVQHLLSKYGRYLNV